MSKKPTTTEWLATFSVGERRWFESSEGSHDYDRRLICGKRGSQRPKILQGKEFQVRLYTAIGAAQANDIRYLLSVERIT